MIEVYLRELRAQLHGAADAEDILAEIRSHIEESGPDVAATLARLGTPAELATLYAVDRSSSPTILVRGLFRWAKVSIGGFFALIGVVVGYGLTISFFLAALIKPFAPHRTGVWWLAGDEISLRLGLGGSPPTYGHEVLGWWIVPIGLAAGALVLWATPRFGRWAVRRFLRRLLV